MTIAGASGDAMSATMLVSMPRAKRLFRWVIAESGAGHHTLNPGAAQRVGGYLAEKLGVPATREALAQVALAAIRSTSLVRTERISQLTERLPSGVRHRRGVLGRRQPPRDPPGLRTQE